MKKRKLCGKAVFPIGLGAMALDEYHPAAAEQEAQGFLQYAAQAGIEVIDTADVYGLGRNEMLIGKALTNKQKERLIIATKAGCTRPGGRGWGTDGRPERIKQAFHESLRRLGMSKLTLYQLHSPDSSVPLAETLYAFKALQDQGFIEHVGLSNVSLEEIKQAQRIIKVASVQNHFNLRNKHDEHDVLPYLTEQGIPYFPYFPLGSGRLLGEKRVRDVAQRIDATPSQVLLAWILHKWPTAILIPGTKQKEHLQDNMAAADISLSREHIKELDSVW